MELGLADSCAVGKALTVMLTLTAWLVPPAPVHVSAYAASLSSAPVLCEPLTASGPLQAPEAAQDVALLELQVSVEDAPALIVLAEAVNETVGTGGGAPEPPPHADRAIGPMIKSE
jgi:hypothetical protein